MANTGAGGRYEMPESLQQDGPLGSWWDRGSTSGAGSGACMSGCESGVGATGGMAGSSVVQGKFSNICLCLSCVIVNSILLYSKHWSSDLDKLRNVRELQKVLGKAYYDFKIFVPK